MGQALVAVSVPGTDAVHKVSIIPRGIGSLGYTIQRPTEDRFLMTRPELENKMSVLLGGRGAEQLIFGEISTGASDDIQKVTNIARSMVTRYGMIESLGNITYEGDNAGFLGGPAPQGWHERTYSETTAREIDQAVKSLVDAAYNRTLAILKSRRQILERGARLLLEKETLVEDELRALVAEDRPAAAQ